ncbi:MAG: hypothetical protein ACYTBW_05765 [Planctomycetota bacterium]
MKYNYIYILFSVGLILICSGCQDLSQPNTSNGTADALNGPYQMAAYLRAEPAVKDAHVWQNSYGPGLTIQTDNYTVHTTLLEPLMLRQVPAFLESAYKAYQSQLPRTLNKTQPLKVYLFDTRAQWEQYTQDTAGAAMRDGINSISGCLCIVCRVGWMKASRHCLRPAVIHRGSFCSSRDRT